MALGGRGGFDHLPSYLTSLTSMEVAVTVTGPERSGACSPAATTPRTPNKQGQDQETDQVPRRTIQVALLSAEGLADRRLWSLCSRRGYPGPRGWMPSRRWER